MREARREGLSLSGRSRVLHVLLMTKHINLLGTFELSGIPPVPRGVPQIEITFGKYKHRVKLFEEKKLSGISPVDVN